MIESVVIKAVARKTVVGKAVVRFLNGH